MSATPPRIIEVPFHIGDFLSGTMHMDATETGAYWMLCVAHYQAGCQGLPNDDVKLARIARVTPHMWQRIRATILAKFSVEGEFIRHKKVIDVLTKISEKSNAAKASALIMLDNRRANAQRPLSERPANQKPKTDKVFNPEEERMSPAPAQASYDVERAVHYTALLKAKKRAAELNRDFRTLCQLYNGFVDTRGTPGDADAAFLGWLERFTEGKVL